MKVFVICLCAVILFGTSWEIFSYFPANSALESGLYGLIGGLASTVALIFGLAYIPRLSGLAQLVSLLSVILGLIAALFAQSLWWGFIGMIMAIAGFLLVAVAIIGTFLYLCLREDKYEDSTEFHLPS